MTKRNAKPAIMAVIIVSSLFAACDLGDLSLSADVDLQNPLRLEISGSATALGPGGTMTLTAAADRVPDEWKWYLDGEPLSGGTASISLGPDLPAGIHCATVVARKGAVTGSADRQFEVRPFLEIDEDFSDGMAQGWEMEPECWQVTDGRLLRSCALAGTWRNAYFSACRYSGAFTCQVDLTAISSSNMWAKGIFIQCAAPNLADRTVSIAFCVSGTKSECSFWVGTCGNGAEPIRWSNWVPYPNEAETLTMKIVTDGAGNNFCYLNGDLVYRWKEESLLAGYVGLTGFDGMGELAEVYAFDNVKLTRNADDFVYPPIESAGQTKSFQAGASAMRAFR